MTLISAASKLRPGEASIDAKTIHRAISTLKPNDLITYEQVSDVVGRDIRKSKGALYTAIRMARDSEGIAFETITNVGIRRMTDSEIVAEFSVKPFRKISSIVRKSSKKRIVPTYRA